MRATRCFGLALLALAALAGCDVEPYEEPRQIDDAPDLPPPADALEAAIRERAPNEAMLMIPHEPVVRGELPEGERRDFTSVLRAGLCYKVLAQGGPGVSDLDLVVYSPNNVLLQRDATQSAAPVIGVQRAICPTETGLYRVEVRMARGGGTFGAQIWVSQ
ncbi:hypothetical protein [Sandaracinus amylolyticus]|uniref:hypothetical protein n=1 Tax=Sandaracinus amylolyticus TaxID=927083 RepID=UPI001F4914A6|nr:hypothetical protein [Sandaracinus amylolyticus]UJR82230.1 Hypothetical protein I5071_42950 [Sandaracinus amylolyticus]